MAEITKTKTRTQTFPTEVVLSIVTRHLLCDKFSMMAQCAAFIKGTPIFTYEFADKGILSQLDWAVYGQFPKIAAYVDKYKAELTGMLDIDGITTDIKSGLIDQWLSDCVYPVLGRDLVVIGGDSTDMQTKIEIARRTKMNEIEVVALMDSSKSEAEWNANCDKVKRAFPDANGRPNYPDFWYPAIIASGLISRVRAKWAI